MIDAGSSSSSSGAADAAIDFVYWLVGGISGGVICIIICVKACVSAAMSEDEEENAIVDPAEWIEKQRQAKALMELHSSNIANKVPARFDEFASYHNDDDDFVMVEYHLHEARHCTAIQRR